MPSPPKVALTSAPESLFWYWIRERHNIYLQRQQGLPKPWTNDPIFQHFKFCNVFRELDRGTIWLRQNFLEPHANDIELLLFNICWYRMFNWIPTAEFLGWQTSWNPSQVNRLLQDRLEAGMQVFTGAHMLRSREGMPKIESTIQICTDIWTSKEQLVEIIRTYRTLERTFNLLLEIDYIGTFLAYEMVTDMRHTRLLQDATDVMTWASANVGAKRGLRRLGLPHCPVSAATTSIRNLLALANLRCHSDTPRLPENFPLMEMRDIEHSLCEFDKYCRVKFDEGVPRSRYQGV